MSTMVRLSWRAAAILLAAAAVSLTPNPSTARALDVPAVSTDRAAVLVALDPPADTTAPPAGPTPDPTDQPTDIPTSGAPATGLPGFQLPGSGLSRTDSDAVGGSVPQDQEDGQPAGGVDPEESADKSSGLPPEVAGTEQELSRTDQEVTAPDQEIGLLAVAIGSSALAAALGALVLIIWWRVYRPDTSRRLAAASAAARAGAVVGAEQPVRRPAVQKDERYRPRHRMPRR
jgi:hypothetical protein